MGHLARGIVFGLVGIFVTKAAFDYRAQDAIGFDGALQKLASAPYGPWLLGVAAAGLVAYGAFCIRRRPLPRRLGGKLGDPLRDAVATRRRGDAVQRLANVVAPATDLEIELERAAEEAQQA